ncbi:MAG TPA: hypothetical protein ENH05_02085 [Rhizobiales bacterium]|nr:hypothetical protein BMS3Bbin10_00673 [bacterium BMS3Bbin10]HDO51506.1 hypothetical protein [Hyphomicrobiales bacterium]
MRFNTRNQPESFTSNDDAEAQRRHESYLTDYFQWLDTRSPPAPEARQVTVTARSPLSPVLTAMQALGEELRSRQITLRVVFCDVDPERALHSIWKTISALSEGSEHGDLVRWNAASGMLEAHEQMILGRRMCWTGDAMRRMPGRRDGFDLFETDAPDICRLGVQSFCAMWRLAQPVPMWLLREAKKVRPNATFAGPDTRALATLSFFRKLERPDNNCH